MGGLLIVLVFMGFGCASLSPSAANNSPIYQVTEQEPLSKAPAEGNYWGWSVAYWLAYFGGQSLANRQ
jgi:hypothetical protein